MLRDLLEEGVRAAIWEQGWSEHHSANEVVSHPRLDALAGLLGVKVNDGMEGVFYDPDSDEITMPPKRCFFAVLGESATAVYYSTLLHEIVHATGAWDRLGRDLSGGRGSQSYAREELVAELASVMLLRLLKMDSDVRIHATYFSMWLTRAGGREEAIETATTEAQHAVRYILEHDDLEHP